MSFIRVEGDVFSGRCLAPVYVAPPENFAGGIHLTALLDSGATNSAITQSIARSVNLPIIGSAQVHSAAFGGHAIDCFAAHLEFWRYGLDINATALVTQLSMVTLVNPMSGIQLLIGMDVLGAAKSFEIEHDRWTLSWDSPKGGSLI